MSNIAFTEQQQNYLRQMRIPMRLSCLSSDGWPIVLSLWYLYRDGKLMCATQNSALVIQYLRQQPRCGFEIAADEPPYCGIRGRGDVELNAALGRDVLEQALIRYTGGLDHELAQKLLAKSGKEVAIVISPHSIYSWNFTNRMNNISTGQNRSYALTECNLLSVVRCVKPALELLQVYGLIWRRREEQTARIT